MPRLTINALRAQVGVLLPDNITQDISAADVRDMFKDTIDTYAPGYGALSQPLVVLPALGITPVIVPFAAVLAQTDDYVANAAGGTIQRLANGLPSTVNRVSFYADVAAPSGNEVVFSLFRDGVDIPGGTTVSGQGAGNLSQAAFSVGTTAEDALDHIYTIRASKISGGADNVEVSNARFILEYVPTIGI
jgi:hypothetical protein